MNQINASDFRAKYLKYKNKYLSLKKIKGGASEWDKLSSSIAGFSGKMIFVQHAAYIGYNDHVKFIMPAHLNTLIKKFKIDIDKLLTELEEDPIPESAQMLQKKIFSNMPKDININEQIDKIPDEHIKKIFQILIEKKTNCTVEQYMNLPSDEVFLCQNRQLVKGSCSEPGFFEKLEAKPGKYKSLNDLFSLVKDKMEYKDQLTIILGASKYPDEFNIKGDSRTLVLYITASIVHKSFITLDEAIKKLSEPEPINVLMISTEFPLEKPDNEILLIIKTLDEIKKSGKNVKIINKICGSCFRTFYHLVKKVGIDYEVSPYQGLDSADTPAIQNCFRYSS